MQGTVRAAAEEIARTISAFPQIALKVDRLSAYHAVGLPLEPALQNEFEKGVAALSEGKEGAQRFAQGAGRHGKF